MSAKFKNNANINEPNHLCKSNLIHFLNALKMK